MNRLAGKKILFVITKSNWGGAQRYVYDLAIGLKKMGTEVQVAFGGTGEANASRGALAVKLTTAGIHGIFLPSFMRDISLLRECKVLWILIDIFRGERPDVIHLNSSKAGGIGALAGRIAGVSRIIFTSHGLAYDEDRPFLARSLIWFATWATFLLSHTVIVISKDNYERARRFPFCKNKIRLVYNGIPEIALKSGEEARRVMRLPANVLTIGTAAEFTKNKGLSYMVQAAKILRDRGLLFKLCLVGTGEDLPAITEQIRRNDLAGFVELLGFVPEAATAFKAFDIFALTSIKEGLPYALLEAGQAGCAVVASRIPGVTDIIDNTTGLLVEAKDPEAVASALETLLHDPKRRQVLGEKLHEHVRTVFSMEKMLEETARAYLP